MAERYWAFSDLLATRVTQGPGVDEEAFAELKQQGLAAFDDGLRALVGESGLQQYEQYARVVNLQGLIQAVAGRLFDTAEPLSATQADQLLFLLADHGSQSDAQPPGETWLRARIEGRESSANAQWTNIDWNATRPKLGSILSAPQIAAVQALRDQADARQRAKVPSGRIRTRTAIEERTEEVGRCAALRAGSRRKGDFDDLVFLLRHRIRCLRKASRCRRREAERKRVGNTVSCRRYSPSIMRTASELFRHNGVDEEP